MAGRVNPQIGKILAGGVAVLTLGALGVATVYLPYYSKEGQARSEAVRRGGGGGRRDVGLDAADEIEADIQQQEQQGPTPAKKGGGSMWKVKK